MTVGVYGSPAILIVAFASMNKKQLFVACTATAVSFLALMATFAHSESSTAALGFFTLWTFGVPLAGIVHLGLVRWNRRSRTPQ